MYVRSTWRGCVHGRRGAPTFVNYFQVVGPSRCASCEYVTDGSKGWAEQERDFREHFNANHADKYGFRLGTTAFFVESSDPQPTADAGEKLCPTCTCDCKPCSIHKTSYCERAEEQARAQGRAEGLERAAEIAESHDHRAGSTSCKRLIAADIRAEARKGEK
jgi:hypothetical protein